MKVLNIILMSALLMGPYNVLVAQVSDNPSIPSDIQTVTLSIEQMTCPACPITVKKALSKVPGVCEVVVSFEDKTATVTFDATQTQVADLIQASTQAGYPAQEKNKTPN